MARSVRSPVSLQLWPDPYVVAKVRALPADWRVLAAGDEPVALVIRPGDLTIVAPRAVLDTLGEDLVEARSENWRAMTLDAVFPLDAVGVWAAVSRALAEVGVPVMAFSSHDTDHFLVPGALLGRALAALNTAGLDRFLPASP